MTNLEQERGKNNPFRACDTMCCDGREHCELAAQGGHLFLTSKALGHTNRTHSTTLGQCLMIHETPNVIGILILTTRLARASTSQLLKSGTESELCGHINSSNQ